MMNPVVKLFLAANVGLYRATSGKIGGSMFGAVYLLLHDKPIQSLTALIVALGSVGRALATMDPTN